MAPKKKYIVFTLDGVDYGYNPETKCHFMTNGVRTFALTRNEYRHMLTEYHNLMLRT